MRLRAFAPAVLAIVCVALPASAYVRSRTKRGARAAWDNPVVGFELYTATPPAELDVATLISAVRTSAATWSKPTLSCTDLQIVINEVDGLEAPAQYDGVNKIGFRRTAWRKIPCVVSETEDCAPYDVNAIAITTVTSNVKTGEILDADMEINAVKNDFADMTRSTQRPTTTKTLQDLQNTVTHELGHAIGLDHNCHVPRPGVTPPEDQNGQTPPLCSRAPDNIAEATMFATAGAGEILKRDLSPDDLAAVCDTYPLGYLGVPDPRDEAGGCSFAGRPRGGLAGLLLAFGLLVRAARRSRHCPSPRSAPAPRARCAS